jgi:hypothetical protein
MYRPLMNLKKILLLMNFSDVFSINVSPQDITLVYLLIVFSDIFPVSIFDPRNKNAKQ